MVEGLAGGVGLVGVPIGLVPAAGDDSGPQEGGEGAAVWACGGVDDVAGRVADGVGGAVFRPDLRALGPCERL